MMIREAVHSNLTIPPGEYLEEVVGELGMTKDELAARMDRPATKLSQIFKGDKAITAETALQLEKVVGVPAHIWIGLESEYRLTLARQREARTLRQPISESSLVKKFCYKELVSLNAVEKRTTLPEKVTELQRFFGVTSLTRVVGLRRYQAAFRCGRSSKGTRSPEALAAWLRFGEVRGQGIQCQPFDRTKLEEAIDSLREMTIQPPDKFLKPLRKTLAEAGVAMVLCPHFSKTQAHGATFWLRRDKAVLMMSNRGKWADIFWFSLFHEIGHLLLQNWRAVCLEVDGKDDQEKKADKFAADKFINPGEYKTFARRGAFYPAEIETFAKHVGVHPGIVVGRLQHDKLLKPNWHNGLRVRFKWADQ
jgi:HTH-type transcriptional regulator/antitoxin HigA